MPLIAILVILFFGLAFAIWAMSNLVGLAILLLVAGFIGWLADAIVPGKLPYGWLGAVVSGLVGAWIGGLILGSLGPDIAGIAIVPALVGTVILAFVINLISKMSFGCRI
jgi:uncharacterized membrane protein YeaQ/YmgE (transglycosylase-associated protein family)